MTYHYYGVKGDYAWKLRGIIHMFPWNETGTAHAPTHA
jgi:hypothetical protein